MNKAILNNIKFSLILFILLATAYQQTSHPAYAAADQYIILANPVRVSKSNGNPLESLLSQYQELAKRALPATWLFTYDSLDIDGLDNFTQQADKNNEFGVWMEVTPKLASESGVLYNKTDSWHRSTSVFLSGYIQPDRLKMVDMIFKKFKSRFGYYPASIGAWWVDSYSLSYMSEKYGVKANLGVSDQHSTDGYHIWGQPWGVPFYPSKSHTGLPASSLANKLNVVNLQWAPRDPLNGYGQASASLYSTQDWFVKGLSLNYFNQLVDLYAQKHYNQYGAIVLGLESDFPPGTYRGIFASEIQDIAAKAATGDFQVLNMQEFSNWYQRRFPQISPNYLITSDDLLGSHKSSYWYQTPGYRLGLEYNSVTQELFLLDLRIYPNNLYEPFYTSPNKGLDLYINTPFILDSASNPSDKLNLGRIKPQISSSPFGPILKLEGVEVIDYLKTHHILPNSQLLKSVNWPYPQGYTFKALSIESSYQLKSGRAKIILLLTIIFLLVLIHFFFKEKRQRFRIIYLTVVIIIISLGGLWYAAHLETYQVLSDELVMLMKLRTLPAGKVLVVEGDCLQCSWQTEYKPAALANQRGYVSEFSEKPIVYSKEFFEAKTRGQARTILKRLGIKYIYLVNYESYQEKIPFSPGDTNSNLLYENGHSQLWEVKQ